jgi:hypothetical protein
MNQASPPRRPARKSESGQALVLLVLALVGLLGFAALALDGGNLYTEQRRAQAAADHAVMAAAFTYMNNASASASDLRSAALAHAASNQYSNDGSTNWVEFYWPPQHGAVAGDDDYIEVMITQTVPTALAHLVFGQSPIPLTVYAVADATPAGPILPGYAIVSFHLGCTGNEFTPRGGVGAIIKDGGVFVNSDPNDPNCEESINMTGENGRLATTTSANCPDDALEATCEVDGSFPIHIGGQQSGPHTTLCTASPDWWTPPEGDAYTDDCTLYGQMVTFYDQIMDPPDPLTVDDFSCGPAAVVPNAGANATLVLNPGTYPNLNQTAPHQTLDLNPGIYCLTDGANVMDAENIIGRGVFVYLANTAAEFKFTGGDFVLSAPFHLENGLDCTFPTDDPAYDPLCAVEGAVLFKPIGPDTCSSSDADIDFSGQGNMVIRGLIWAPESFLNYTGHGNLYQTGQALVGCVKYAGNGELDITYSPNETFSPPPSIRLDE